MHQILMAGGRVAEKHPGEFRRSQNWIGSTHPFDTQQQGNQQASDTPVAVQKRVDCLELNVRQSRLQERRCSLRLIVQIQSRCGT